MKKIIDSQALTKEAIDKIFAKMLFFALEKIYISASNTADYSIKITSNDTEIAKIDFNSGSDILTVKYSHSPIVLSRVCTLTQITSLSSAISYASVYRIINRVKNPPRFFVIDVKTIKN